MTWYEWDADAGIIASDDWILDRDTLRVALLQTGWVSTGRTVAQALDTAEIDHTWYGLDDDRNPVLCDVEGITEDDEPVTSGPFRVTLVYFDNALLE